MECTSNGSESNLEGGLVRGGRSSEIDFAHASFADFLKNLVMANGLADHTNPPHRNAVVLNVTT